MNGVQLLGLTLKSAIKINIKIALILINTIIVFNLTLSLTPAIRSIMIKMIMIDAGRLIIPPALGGLIKYSGRPILIATSALLK